MLKNMPAILFPMRMEVYNPRSANELWVRWYPDSIQVFPPVDSVTPDERKAYEEYRYATGKKPSKGAWSKFVRQVGVNRAGYVKEVCEKGFEPVKGVDEALAEFVERGAALKLLPDYVVLYAVKQRFVKNQVFNKMTCELVTEINEVGKGNQIPEDLVLSPDLLNPALKSRWAVDFKQAVYDGMATIISDPVLYNKIAEADWLIAVGFRGQPTEKAHDLVQELFYRYKAMGRLDILKQGTATNNTEDEKTPFTQNPGISSNSMNENDAGANCRSMDARRVLCHALGVSEEVIQGLGSSASADWENSAAMNMLLWNACTVSYHGFQIVKKGQLEVFRIKNNRKLWSALTQHFINYVSASGTVPPVQVGKNPYGVLPVTCLDKWVSSEQGEQRSVEEGVRRVCSILKTIFLKMSALGQRSSNVTESEYEKLLKTMQLNAVPHRIDFQTITLGGGFDSDLIKLDCDLVHSEDLVSIHEYLREMHERMSMFVQQPGGEYKRSCVADFWKKGIDEKWSLLYRLLIYSLMKMDEEFFEIASSKAFSEKDKHAECLFFMSSIENMLAAVSILQNKSTDEIKERMLQTLDLFSCRLDAWISSLATSRLLGIDLKKGEVERNSDLAAGTKDSVVGVFGWLENPLGFKPGENAKEFFQAPSLGQAVTGAVLRNAALLDRNNPQNAEWTHPFQINLSSERVREAVWYTKGLQSGYMPSELFGYRAERELHDMKLDRYMELLREKYPMTGQEQDSRLNTTQVINGEALLQESSFDMMLNEDTRFSSLNDGEKRKLADALKKIKHHLEQLNDSASDLYIAEAVHQSIHGNTARASAFLEVFQGKGLPPEPQMINTPRTGYSQVKRVNLPMVEESDGLEPVSIADPFLSAFCTSILKDYDNQYLEVTVTRADQKAGSDNAKSIVVHMNLRKDLFLEPLELVTGGKPELEARAKLNIWNDILAGHSGWEILGLDFLKDPDPTAFERMTNITFGPCDITAKAALLHKLLKSTQPLSREDIFADEETDFSLVCANRLETYKMLVERCKKLKESLDKDLQMLGNLWKAFAAEKNKDNLCRIIEDLSGQLLVMRRYGFKEALLQLPSFHTEEGKQKLVETVGKLIDKMKKREETLPVFVDEVRQESPGVEFPIVRYDAGSDRFIGRKDEKDPGTLLDSSETGDILAAVNKLVEESVELLRIRTMGEEMVVLPPFFLTDKVDIPGSMPFSVSNFHEVFDGHRKVRSALDTAARVLENRPEMKVFDLRGVQRSVEEIQLQAKMSIPLIKEEDILDWPKFIGLLRDAGLRGNPRTVSRIWSFLDNHLKSVVLKLAPGVVPDAKHQAMIIHDLNRILSLRSIYRADVFKNVNNFEANSLLVKKIPTLSANEILRLNRHLLDEAFVGYLQPQMSLEEAEHLISELSVPAQSACDLYYVVPKNGLKMDTDRCIAGIRIDEWNEFIPNDEETTAVAFRLNTPKSQAPQAVLIAVTPEIDKQAMWDCSSLAEVVVEAIDLMRIRSVPTERIADSSLQFAFPALLFEGFNNQEFFTGHSPELADKKISGKFYYRKA